MSGKRLFHGRKGSTLNLTETNVLLLSNVLASSVMTLAVDAAVAHRPGELKHGDANYSLESRRSTSAYLTLCCFSYYSLVSPIACIFYFK